MKFYRPNYDVMDSISTRFIALINKHSMRNISNLLIYCSDLNYVNHLLFESIEKEIIRRVKQGIIEEDKEQE